MVANGQHSIEHRHHSSQEEDSPESCYQGLEQTLRNLGAHCTDLSCERLEQPSLGTSSAHSMDLCYQRLQQPSMETSSAHSTDLRYQRLEQPSRGTSSAHSTDLCYQRLEQPLLGTSSAQSMDLCYQRLQQPSMGTSSAHSTDLRYQRLEQPSRGTSSAHSTDLCYQRLEQPLLGTSSAQSMDLCYQRLQQPSMGTSSAHSTDLRYQRLEQPSLGTSSAHFTYLSCQRLEQPSLGTSSAHSTYLSCQRLEQPSLGTSSAHTTDLSCQRLEQPLKNSSAHSTNLSCQRLEQPLRNSSAHSTEFCGQRLELPLMKPYGQPQCNVGDMRLVKSEGRWQDVATERSPVMWGWSGATDYPYRLPHEGESDTSPSSSSPSVEFPTGLPFSGAQTYMSQSPPAPSNNVLHYTGSNHGTLQCTNGNGTRDRQDSKSGNRQRKPKRPRSPPQQSADHGLPTTSRDLANVRERQRTELLNKAFSELQQTIPTMPSDKLSKIQTLKLAHNYIKFLEHTLDGSSNLLPRDRCQHLTQNNLRHAFSLWRHDSQ
ncbi:hypothetical protein ACOMHN_049838 [Nucella lapillus]